MSKDHKWEMKEIDGAHMGVDDFWICIDCGASGGPVRKSRKPKPFLAGPAICLSDDCEAAKIFIRALFNELLISKKLNAEYTELLNEAAGKTRNISDLWSFTSSLVDSRKPVEEIRELLRKEGHLSR